MPETRDHPLRALLLGQDTASLGTLKNGAPFVSMAPYALMPGTGRAILHVSKLAAHTGNMEANPAVSLLVMAERDPAVSSLARPRVTIEGEASTCRVESPDYEAARAAYQARFPDSDPLVALHDFRFVVIEPRSIRHVGGFASARTYSDQEFAQIMAGEI